MANETDELKEADALGGSRLEAVVSRQYSQDNWAHKALLLMDEAESLIRFGAVTAPVDRYTPAATAFWEVCKMLADERDIIEADLAANSD